jgi:hypothetical protein
METTTEEKNELINPQVDEQPDGMTDAEALKMFQGRFKVAMEYSRTIKDKLFNYYSAYHAYIDQSYPYNSKYCPRTIYNAVERNVERIMQTIFSKEEYFDVRGKSRQPEIAEYVQYAVSKYSLDDYSGFKAVMLEMVKSMVQYGVGIVKVCPKAMPIPIFKNGQMIEVPADWAVLQNISPFDAFPAPFASDIDSKTMANDMPFFIHREVPPGGIIELRKLAKEAAEQKYGIEIDDREMGMLNPNEQPEQEKPDTAEPMQPENPDEQPDSD